MELPFHDNGLWGGPPEVVLEPLTRVTTADLEPAAKEPLTPITYDQLSTLRAFSTNDFLDAVAEEDGGAFVRALHAEDGRSLAIIGYAGRRKPSIISLKVQGVHELQFVRVLSVRQGEDALFICPVVGGPCHTLYLRENHFAGPDAQLGRAWDLGL